MNGDIDNDKDYPIRELKQKISYYEPYKQKYEDLKEDWKYIKSLLDKEFNERTRLKKENEQLKKQIQIYEQLISNSYVGEEETLDGFVGKYVIWEDELQKYKEKIKKVIDDE